MAQARCLHPRDTAAAFPGGRWAARPSPPLSTDVGPVPSSRCCTEHSSQGPDRRWTQLRLLFSPCPATELAPPAQGCGCGMGAPAAGGVPWAPTKSFHQGVVLGGSAGAGGSQHCPLPAPPLHIPAHCWPHSPSRQLNFGEKKIPRFHGNRRRKVSGAGAGMEPAGTRAAGPAAPQGWPHSPCSPPLPGPVGARPAASTSRGTAWASGSGGSSLPPRCVGRELTFRSAAQRVAMQREL